MYISQALHWNKRQRSSTLSWVVLAALTVLCGCTNAPSAVKKLDVLHLPYGVQSLAWHPDGKQLAVGYFLRDEVEVWDVSTKTSVLRVPSKRRPINESGQEAIFSQDGKYLVVQDFLDTKSGGPPIPDALDHPGERAAEQDHSRYIIARVWDVSALKEVAQVRGPASVLHARSLEGMCWIGGKSNRLAILRGSVVADYEIPAAEEKKEVNLLSPFKDHPGIYERYWSMSCHPSKPELALVGAKLFKRGEPLGLSLDSEAGPIVIAELEQGSLKYQFFSTGSLVGLAYSADGNTLVSFGRGSISRWDSAKAYAPLGDMSKPPEHMGHVAPLPSGNRFVGAGGSKEGRVLFYAWEANQQEVSAQLALPRETFRFAVNAAASMAAVADGTNVNLYQIDASALKLTDVTGRLMPMPPPLSVGEVLDPNSDYAKFWPGKPALIKLKDTLILAVPPQYQKFWTQRDYQTGRDSAIRPPMDLDKLPTAKLAGFSMHMPGFTGYTPSNYRLAFNQDRIDIVSISSAPASTASPDAPGAFPPNQFKRLSTGPYRLFDPDKYEERYGLSCYTKPDSESETRFCYGQRDSQLNEDFILRVMEPPYAPGVAFPLMQTNYFTRRYGGLEITWRAHMKHWPRWKEIDQQIWKLVESWNVAP